MDWIEIQLVHYGLEWFLLVVGILEVCHHAAGVLTQKQLLKIGLASVRQIQKLFPNPARLYRNNQQPAVMIIGYRPYPIVFTLISIAGPLRSVIAFLIVASMIATVVTFIVYQPRLDLPPTNESAAHFLVTELIETVFTLAIPAIPLLFINKLLLSYALVGRRAFHQAVMISTSINLAVASVWCTMLVTIPILGFRFLGPPPLKAFLIGMWQHFWTIILPINTRGTGLTGPVASSAFYALSLWSASAWLLYASVWVLGNLAIKWEGAVWLKGNPVVANLIRMARKCFATTKWREDPLILLGFIVVGIVTLIFLMIPVFLVFFGPHGGERGPRQHASSLIAAKRWGS